MCCPCKQDDQVVKMDDCVRLAHADSSTPGFYTSRINAEDELWTDQTHQARLVSPKDAVNESIKEHESCHLRKPLKEFLFSTQFNCAAVLM